MAFLFAAPTLKWARSEGCPWDSRTCSSAAKGGHLEVLKWARLQGCPWDSRTCANAAEGGHLEVIKANGLIKKKSIMTSVKYKPFAIVKQNQNRVIVKLEGLPKDDEDCVRYLDKLKTVYAQKNKFLILFDARKIGWISFKHIQLQAAFMRKMEPETRKYMTRCAIVVQSWGSKAVLQTLFKFRKPAAPLEIFQDIKLAKDYLRGADLPLMTASQNRSSFGIAGGAKIEDDCDVEVEIGDVEATYRREEAERRKRLERPVLNRQRGGT